MHILEKAKSNDLMNLLLQIHKKKAVDNVSECLANMPPASASNVKINRSTNLQGGDIKRAKAEKRSQAPSGTVEKTQR